MRLSIKTKQVAGVTLVVGLVAIVLTVWFLTLLVRLRLQDSRDRAELLGNVIAQSAFAAVAAGVDPYDLQSDAGLSAILGASLLDDNVLYAAIVDPNRVTIAHYDPAMVDQPLPRPSGDDLDSLIRAGPVAQYAAISQAYQGVVRTYEVRIPLLLGPQGDAGGMREFGSVVIGISTGLAADALTAALLPPLYAALGAMVVAVIVASLLAQVMLRPIHVIRSGLARLGRGELDVDVELPGDEELGEIGESIKAVSERLAAGRSQTATLQSVVEHLEDAVAVIAPDGTLLFANTAMSQALGGDSGRLDERLPADHPYRVAVEEAMAAAPGDPVTPRTVTVPDAGERLVVADRISGADQDSVGVLLVARNVAYLSEVESTLSYSRKLAALGRLSASIAHEVKNPLNATMIHLELLRAEVQAQPDAMEHVSVITAQVRRLDEVVQGFLKFTRPEDLRLKPVTLVTVVDSALPIIEAEAESHGVSVEVSCPADLEVSADAGLLEQAFLNLGLNACQAMPDGGRLRIAARPAPNRRVEVTFEDTGVGIPPEQLQKVFDLYFTTKTHGSGIGLSLVYRTIQLHDGEIEVQSVPGRGTTFRLLLRRALEKPASAPRAAS